jgi:hypothetical protein
MMICTHGASPFNFNFFESMSIERCKEDKLIQEGRKEWDLSLDEVTIWCSK